MILIAGLGNPENRYAATRHNTGFLVADRLAARHGIRLSRSESGALLGTGMVAGTKVLLAEPQTYMNASGSSIQPLCAYYRLDPEKELLVIVDDIHLGQGVLRLREGGSAGGHNGLKDIIGRLGTDRFPRLRVGVGEAAGDLIPHVLGNFSRQEWELMDRALEDACDCVELFLSDGIGAAMNRYNARDRKVGAAE